MNMRVRPSTAPVRRCDVKIKKVSLSFDGVANGIPAQMPEKREKKSSVSKDSEVAQNTNTGCSCYERKPDCHLCEGEFVVDALYLLWDSRTLSCTARDTRCFSTYNIIDMMVHR